jgi:hypothetical protein
VSAESWPEQEWVLETARELGYRLPPELVLAFASRLTELRPKNLAKLQVTDNGHLWLHLDPGQGKCKASLNLTIHHQKSHPDSVIQRALAAVTEVVAKEQADAQG